MKNLGPAIWIDSDGSWSAADIGPIPSGDLLRRGMRGGLFELVPLPPLASKYRVDLWCYEEGLMKRLPVNILGSLIAGRRICGPIVLTGGPDSHGRTHGLDAHAVELVIDRLNLDPSCFVLWPPPVM